MQRTTCTHIVDFTNIISKDVFIAGLSDDEVKREVLGWHDLDEKSIEGTVAYVEAKEMARDAMNRGSTNAAVSTYKKANKLQPRNDEKSTCRDCKTEIEKVVWSRRQRRMVERHFCSKCWTKKSKSKGNQQSRNLNNSTEEPDVTGAIMIGSIGPVKPAAPRDHLLFDS